MISGDATTALSQPFTAVVSEKYAKMYFGNEDPIGKMLLMNDDDGANELVKVTGVFKDLPQNTHMKFDILFSYKTLFARGDWAVGRYDQSWKRRDMYVFLTLTPGTDPKTVEAKLPALVSKYKPDNVQQNVQESLFLQPLTSIHLKSALADEPEINGDERIVNFLSIIGVFVLVIAWINYINLSTAKALERAKEVGVRKVMGAMKGQLVRQFLVEAALVNMVSVLIAMFMVAAVLQYFNSISGLALTLSYLFESWYLSLALLLWVCGTALSGSYPALVLSSFRPVSVLKGKLKNSFGGVLLRKSLVVFQFIASVALIAGTLIVFNQLKFMMNHDIGMNIDQVLCIEAPGIIPSTREEFDTSLDAFRNELKQDPTVMAMSASATVPGKLREYKRVVKRYGAPADQEVSIKSNSMDYEFIDVFKMRLIAGRLFDEKYPQDSDTSIVVTESAAKLLGFKNPEDAIGQPVTVVTFNWNPVIVGVVNDYHQLSLKKNIDPSFFYLSKEGEFYNIRLNTSDVQSSVENVRKAWTKAFPGNPMDYFFLDDFFNRQYENERKFGKTIHNIFDTRSDCKLYRSLWIVGLHRDAAHEGDRDQESTGINRARNICIAIERIFETGSGVDINCNTP